MANSLNSCEVHSHSHATSAQTWYEQKLMQLEKVCAVALGIFSAYVDIHLFAPSFLAGICLGAYNYQSGQTTSEFKEPVSCCAHSTLEQLTGEKLPAIVTLAFLVSEAVCHIDHHPVVFVPIVGIALGNWMGKRVTFFIHSYLNKSDSNAPASA